MPYCKIIDDDCDVSRESIACKFCCARFCTRTAMCAAGYKGRGQVAPIAPGMEVPYCFDPNCLIEADYGKAIGEWLDLRQGGSRLRLLLARVGELHSQGE